MSEPPEVDPRDLRCRICQRGFAPPNVTRYGASSYCQDCVASVTGAALDEPTETTAAERGVK